MDLGKAIKRARGKYFTQQEVANITGVTNVYVSLVEKGKRECSLSWLSKFADTVGLSVPVIFYMAMGEEDATVGMEDEYKVMKPLLDSYMQQCFGAEFAEPGI